MLTRVVRAGRAGSHYETLGIAANSSAADIKQAYRLQARKLHPGGNSYVISSMYAHTDQK